MEGNIVFLEILLSIAAVTAGVLLLSMAGLGILLLIDKIKESKTSRK
jgi:hypothetical protein